MALDGDDWARRRNGGESDCGTGGWEVRMEKQFWRRKGD